MVELRDRAVQAGAGRARGRRAPAGVLILGGAWCPAFYRLRRCCSAALLLADVAPDALASLSVSSGTAPPRTPPNRATSGATTISALSSLIALTTASATCAGGTSPAAAGALSPVSAHI